MITKHTEILSWYSVQYSKTESLVTKLRSSLSFPHIGDNVVRCKTNTRRLGGILLISIFNSLSLLLEESIIGTDLVISGEQRCPEKHLTSKR